MKKMDVDVSVGKRLRSRRTEMGLSQEAVAKAVGITFQQVQKYEKGANAMNASRLYELARFIDKPVEYFFEDLEQSRSVLHQKNLAQTTPAKSGHNLPSVSDRELLEMMKAFHRIQDRNMRKRISDFVRAIANDFPIIS